MGRNQWVPKLELMQLIRIRVLKAARRSLLIGWTFRLPAEK
jgi:hypothetical protein